MGWGQQVPALIPGIEARRGCGCPVFPFLLLFSWDRISHKFGARLVASKFQSSFCLQVHPYLPLGLQACVWPHLVFYMGAEDLNSGPHACTANFLTHWAVSPAPYKSYTLLATCICHLAVFYYCIYSLVVESLKARGRSTLVLTCCWIY